MLESHPLRSPGRAFGLAITAILILLDAGLLILLLSRPISLLSLIFGVLILISLPVIALVAFGIAGVASARYFVAGGHLVIEWGRQRRVIPLEQIHAIQAGQDSDRVTGFRGLRWPGLMFGRGRINLEGDPALEAFFYATRPAGEQLFVRTGSQVIGLSPHDRPVFEAGLAALLQSGIDDENPPMSSEPGFPGWPIWGDRKALYSLAAAIALNLVLFAVLITAQGRLPAEVPLDIGRAGTVNRLGPPSGLLMLPLMGLVAWLVGLFVGWYFTIGRGERAIGAIIWWATVGIELATWVGAITLVRSL